MKLRAPFEGIGRINLRPPLAGDTKPRPPLRAIREPRCPGCGETQLWCRINCGARMAGCWER